MRKRIIDPQTEVTAENWLDPAEIAQVEVTSEEASHPIEGALLLDRTSGWIASAPGPQLIRLLFDIPQCLQRIKLTFQEEHLARTQEFVLSWSAEAHGEYQVLVRQQYTFAPPNTVSEVEEYVVELEASVVELRINPSIDSGSAKASLASLRIA